MGMKKLTIEYIREQFEEEGYKLLSEEYVNSKQKLEYECSRGHRHSISWGNWNNRKARCPYCSGQVKHELEEIRLLMIKEGYVLLSEKYISNKQHLDYVCPNGHRHRTRWDNWINNKRCPICAGQGKPTIDEVRSSFGAEGYILLSTDYVNSKTKLNYICPKGHKGSTSWDGWKSGNKCGRCVKNVKHTIKFVRDSFEKEGYTLLSTEYKNQKQKLNYICPLGHNNSITWTDWRNGGYRCPTCFFIRNSGSGNYAWRGGISYEPYCPIWKDKEYKEDIKTRDDYRCLNPCCDSKKPNDLTIHHIDYDKKNCSPKNLITICRVCNIRANIERDWHTSWYQAILSKRYNYKY